MAVENINNASVNELIINVNGLSRIDQIQFKIEVNKQLVLFSGVWQK